MGSFAFLTAGILMLKQVFPPAKMWFKPLGGPRTPFCRCCGHKTGLFPTGNAERFPRSPLAEAPGFHQLPFHQGAPFPLNPSLRFVGKFYPFFAPKPPKQWLLLPGKVVAGFRNRVQVPGTRTSLLEEPSEL